MSPLKEAFVKDLIKLRKKYLKNGESKDIAAPVVSFGGFDYHDEQEIREAYGCAFISEATRARLTEELCRKIELARSGKSDYMLIVKYIDDFISVFTAKEAKK